MRKSRLGTILALGLFMQAAFSQTAPLTAEQRQEAVKNAVEAAKKVAIQGPAVQPFLDQAAFSVEKGFVFVPRDEAAGLMRAWGNVVGPNFVGLVLAPNADWVATVNFVKDGYVKDDDAKNWNADDLFDHLQKGAEADNEDRRSRGYPEIELLGWIERPAYDPTTHRLVWSVMSKEKNAPGNNPNAVNYNTYLLGREGYFSIDLVTSYATIEERKPIARTILADVAFNSGKRYEDFSSSTDKVAAYGLAALVGGIALKKLGLLALAAGFFLKFAKIIGLGALAIAAAARKFFRRRQEESR